MKVTNPRFQHLPILQFTFKWIFVSLVVSLGIGTASAWFLLSLDWVTHTRLENEWLIFLLPIGGLIIGWLYHSYGTDVVKGNNQLLEEFHSPKKIIPFKMAPLVLIGTLITHLVGGSAGREGTAVQMGGAIADQFTKWFKFRPRDRKLLLIIGVSGGFASVFGTPLAGAVFALEVFVLGKMRYEALIPSFFAAFLSDWICDQWGVHHAIYNISSAYEIEFWTFFYVIISGIVFGLIAFSFSKTTHLISDYWNKWISYPILRPVIGGTVFAIIIYVTGAYKFIGLGVPIIQEAFVIQAAPYDFAVKLVLTAFTLAVGFKGGEVTPLFFIGATAGSALAFILPIPFDILAGIGFIAVFAGATNTPIACTLMGIELFGSEYAILLGLGSAVAYLFSGHSGIYTSQIIENPKHTLLSKRKL